MKLKIKVGDLSSAIKIACTEHSKSNAIPSFQNINLKEVDGKLQVSVIDGLLAIRTIVEPISLDAGFSCSVDIEKLAGIVKGLDNSKEMTITQRDDSSAEMYKSRTLINCGKSKYEMASNYESEINVPIPSSEEFEDIALNARDFILALQTGLPFLEKESSAVESMAFYFVLKFGGDDMEIFTGGMISNRGQVFKGIKSDEAQVALSRKILKAIDAAFENDSQFKLRISDKKSMFFTDKTMVIITNQSVAIPKNTRGIYNSPVENYFIVKKDNLRSCINRIISCADSKCGIQISEKGGKLIVGAKDLDKQIAAQEEVDAIDIKIGGDIFISGETLLDVLDVAAEDEVKINYVTRGEDVVGIKINDIDSDGNVYNTMAGTLKYN